MLVVSESQLTDRVGQISEGQLTLLFAKLDLVLGRG